MKQLLILSGKGGTGKTTVAAAFIKLSKAKVYADCDVDAPNLHLIAEQPGEAKKRDYYALPVAEIDPERCTACGRCIENCRFDAISVGEAYTIDSFACEGCGVCELVCPAEAVSLKPAVAGELILYADGNKVFSTAQLKMGSGTSGFLVTEVKKQLQTAPRDVEFAIVDGSPGIGCPVIASISGADLVLIVAEPSVSGISDMERIIKTAAKFGTKTAVCVNKFDANIEKTEAIEAQCKKYGLIFTGRIPFDTKVGKAVNRGDTIVDIDCASGTAVKAIYDRTIKLLLEEAGARG